MEWNTKILTVITTAALAAVMMVPGVHAYVKIEYEDSEGNVQIVSVDATWENRPGTSQWRGTAFHGATTIAKGELWVEDSPVPTGLADDVRGVPDFELTPLECVTTDSWFFPCGNGDFWSIGRTTPPADPDERVEDTSAEFC